MISDVEARLRLIERESARLRRRADSVALAIGAQAQAANLVRTNVGAVGGAACTATINGTVDGASPGLAGALQGVAVTVTGPGTTQAAATNSSGGYSVTVDAAGTWTVTITHTRLATTAQTQVVACGNSYSVNFTGASAPAAASGYHYLHVCSFPIKDTLTVADSNGTHTGLLTFDAASSTWIGCYSRVGASGAVNGGHGCASSLVTCPVAYALRQSDAALNAYYPGCDAVTFAPTTGSCPRGAGFTNEGSTGFMSIALPIACPPSTVQLNYNSFQLPTFSGSLVNGTLQITE